MANPARDNIILADSDPARRRAIEAYLRDAGFGYRSFSTAWELLQEDAFYDALAMIIDYDLEGLSAPLLLGRITQSGYRSPPTIIVGPENAHIAVRAMQLGAKDYQPTPVSKALLLESLARIESPRPTRPPVSEPDPEVAAIGKRIGTLSPQQKAVLALIAAQKTSIQIAERMDISQATVNHHRRELLKKMQARSATDLMRMITLARQAGIDPD